MFGISNAKQRVNKKAESSMIRLFPEVQKKFISIQNWWCQC